MDNEYVMIDGELYHFGVKGMKWGKRRYQNPDGTLTEAGKAREVYREAKKTSRAADYVARRTSRRAFGIAGIQGAKKAQKEANKAYVDMVNAKAQFKSINAETKEKAEKIADKVYKNAMKKNGIRDSYSDSSSGGKSTALYNSMKAQKGKAYADKIETRVQNEAVVTLAATAAVYVGAVVVQAMVNAYDY